MTATKILIVDDEPDVDRLMRLRLRRRVRAGQIELLSAADGVEALEVLASNTDIRVALCDINMPRMDGLTLLDRMQSHHPAVQTVIISAYCDAGHRSSAMGRGAIELLGKPLDFRELDRLLDRLLVAEVQG